jgi:hypothetical protein
MVCTERDCCLVGSLCEGKGDSEAVYQVAGLTCLSRSSNQTKGTDRRNQMNQISATRREMISAVGSLPENQNVSVYSFGERREGGQETTPDLFSCFPFVL